MWSFVKHNKFVFWTEQTRHELSTLSTWQYQKSDKYSEMIETIGVMEGGGGRGVGGGGVGL